MLSAQKGQALARGWTNWKEAAEEQCHRHQPHQRQGQRRGTVRHQDVPRVPAGLPVDVRPVRDRSTSGAKGTRFKIIKLDRKRNNIEWSAAARRGGEQSSAPSANNCWASGKAPWSGAWSRTSPPTTVRLSTASRRPAAHHRHGVEARASPAEVVKRRRRAGSTHPQVRPPSAPRVSLGLHQQLGESVGQHRPAATRHHHRQVSSNITDYGCFVRGSEAGRGRPGARVRDGLDQQNVNPSKVLQIGEEVQVMVLDVD